jgi:hypothetical protein
MKSFSFNLFFLSSCLLAISSQLATAQNITYGEMMFIQNYNVANTWVFRSDGQDIQDIYLYNAIQREANIQNAEFAFVSTNTIAAAQDPKYGQCVKYGDTLYVSNGSTGGWYWTVNDQGSIYSGNGQLFTVRSNQGNGLTNEKLNVDPLYGYCVQEDAVVYIQQMEQNGLWVGMNGPLNYFDAGYLVASASATISTPQVQNPMWILSSTLSDGSTSYGVACPGVPQSTTGHWQIIQGSANSSGQKITVTTGTTTTTSSSITQTASWQASITAEASAGFSFAGASASTKVSVSAQYGEKQSSSISKAVAITNTVSTEQDFPSGQVWQFVYGTQDACDTSGFNILVEEFALTSGSDQYPCCLPGLFEDPSNPHGPCQQDTPCACDADICSGSSTGSGSSRGLRGSRN